MEDDLKIFKVEYLSNRLLDQTQIKNLSLYDQIILFKSSIWRWPPLEGNKIKIEISQQPLIGSYLDFKLWLIWPNHVF